MTPVSVSYLATSEQHVVQFQRVALPVPQHHPRKLVKTVVWLLALDQGYGTEKKALVQRNKIRNSLFL